MGARLCKRIRFKFIIFFDGYCLIWSFSYRPHISTGERKENLLGFTGFLPSLERWNECNLWPTAYYEHQSLQLNQDLPSFTEL